MEVVSDLFSSEKCCYLTTAAAILGTFFVARLVLRELCGFCSGFRAFFLAPMGIGRVNLKKYGSWAAVTGASEGIGKAYALELAKRGLNVVLMSRSQEKLDKVAAEIKEKFGRETRVISVDFSGGQEIYEPLAKELSSLDIGVLVNNVGFAYEYPDNFGNVAAERLYKIVQINCQPIVQMSRIMLPKMVKKGGGVIVNISSSASLSCVPMFSVYSATKIFVNYISDGIRKEYGSKGILVQNVMPFYVATAMSGIRRASFMVPNAPAYAKAAVATIGVQNDTFGCFSHAIQGYVASRLPGFVFDHIGRSASEQAKQRYLRKQAKAKAN